jgi:hypothetical protein
MLALEYRGIYSTWGDVEGLLDAAGSIGERYTQSSVK